MLPRPCAIVRIVRYSRLQLLVVPLCALGDQDRLHKVRGSMTASCAWARRRDQREQNDA